MRARSTLAVLSVVLSAAATARGADGWQRIVCIDDPRLRVTLLLKPVATPADEEFVGFELENHTGEPLTVTNAHYRIDDVRVRPRGGGAGAVDTNMASGNEYDLLWREGPRPPKDGPRQDVIPPGVTRRMRYSSVYSFALLGWPAERMQVEGRVHFNISLADRHPLVTPRPGLPFRFEWDPPDAAGVEAIRARLRRVLATPGDPFGDAHLLRTLLAREQVASAVTVEELLAGLARHDQVTRPVIAEHVDRHYPTHEATIAFWIDAIRRRDRLLFRELIPTERIKDPRLIDPLVAWVRDHPHPFQTWQLVLRVLQRHQDLMPDRRATTAELGRIALERSPVVAAGAVPKEGWGAWHEQVQTLALTGDANLVPRLVPYLDHTDVAVDARRIAVANNGVSTRACDSAYNAILDLLDRPGERFSLGIGEFFAPGLPPDQEYARRDRLIAQLKQELAR